MIELNDSPFFVVSKTEPIRAIHKQTLAAGVSAFGFGGSYVHVILSEAGKQEKQPDKPGSHLVLLSAGDLDGLKTLALTWKEYLSACDERLCDVAFTSRIGRSARGARLALIVGQKEDLLRALEAFGAEGNANEANGCYYGFVEKKRGKKPPVTTQAEQSLEELAGIWTAGGRIKWQQNGRDFRRIHLPVCHFEGRSYWIS